MNAPVAEDRHLVALWFRRLWAESRAVLALLIALSILNAALVVAFPWFWQYLIDAVRDDPDPGRLAEVGLWMLAVGVAQTAVYIVLQGSRSVMNARIQWRARTRVFGHLSELPPAFYRRSTLGDLVTRLSDDAGEKLSWFLCSGIFRALEAGFIVVACLVAMVSIDPVLAVLVGLPLPLLLAGQATVQTALADRYRAVQTAISAINDQLTTLFSGVRILQAFRLEDAAEARFMERADQQQTAEIRTAWLQQAVFMMYGYGWQLTIVALLLAGGWRVTGGHITLGELVAFEGFVMTLVWPMFDFGMFVSRYKQAGVSLARLETLLDEPATQPGAAPFPDHPSLSVQGATVHADDGVRLLGELDFDLPAGSFTAVAGEVGSGKSTLIGLLAGLREPGPGRVRIGAEDRSALPVDTVAELLAVVPQDPVLVSDSLRHNILLGREISSAQLDQALEISRLAQDLPQLPDGLDTAVGERGVTLSGGQQQRVALARALVGRPRILLLDDATAALDADTEAAFWQQLDAELPGITAVVATHRPATLERADRILVLDGGELVQQGSHAELLASQGPYRRVYGRFRDLERLGG